MGYGIAVDSCRQRLRDGLYRIHQLPDYAGAFQTDLGGDQLNGDAFVSKLNATGAALVYSTYLGGSGVENYPGTPHRRHRARWGGQRLRDRRDPIEQLPGYGGRLATAL